MKKSHFYILYLIYISLLYLILTLPIGPNEQNTPHKNEILHHISNLFYGFFKNNLDFRVIFFIFGILNIYLFFLT